MEMLVNDFVNIFNAMTIHYDTDSNQSLTVARNCHAAFRCVTWNTDGGRSMLVGLNGHEQGRPCVAN